MSETNYQADWLEAFARTKDGKANKLMTLWAKALGGEAKLKGLFPYKFGPNSGLVPTNDEKGKYRFFRAFELVKPDAVNYLVIGQDPYPDPHKATGVAFLVPEGVDDPTSLGNLRNRLFPAGVSDLEEWAHKEGVLLINAALTFESREKAKEHLAEWSKFIEAVIRCVREKKPDVEIIALGVAAADVAKKALIICNCHPAARGMSQKMWKKCGPLRG